MAKEASEMLLLCFENANFQLVVVVVGCSSSSSRLGEVVQFSSFGKWQTCLLYRRQEF